MKESPAIPDVCLGLQGSLCLKSLNAEGAEEHGGKQEHNDSVFCFSSVNLCALCVKRFVDCVFLCEPPLFLCALCDSVF